MIDCDLVQGWDGLLLHLTNDEILDLGELPVVSETEDGCPIFGRRFVDRVYTAEGAKVGTSIGTRGRDVETHGL